MAEVASALILFTLLALVIRPPRPWVTLVGTPIALIASTLALWVSAYVLG